MSFSVAPLLIHSTLVPDHAKAVLRDAFALPEPERAPLLAEAARILFRDADLDCPDALELVGLPASPCGC